MSSSSLSFASSFPRQPGDKLVKETKSKPRPRFLLTQVQEDAIYIEAVKCQAGLSLMRMHIIHCNHQLLLANHTQSTGLQMLDSAIQTPIHSSARFNIKPWYSRSHTTTTLDNKTYRVGRNAKHCVTSTDIFFTHSYTLVSKQECNPYILLLI